MHTVFLIKVFLLLAIVAHAQQPLKTAGREHLPSKGELAKIKKANLKRAAKTRFRYFIIAADNNTFGYSIYADGNLYIYQNTIPGFRGNKGFADTASAAKTARLVIHKLRKGEMPPSVTVQELKKLDIIP